MGTVMSGEYTASQSYDVCVLESPSIDLTGTTAPLLVFKQYVHTESGYDGGNVRVSDDGGATWTFMDNTVVDPDYYETFIGSMEAYAGDHSGDGWHEVQVDLAAFAGATVQIRFAFYSDSIIFGPGWYVDSLMVVD